MRKKRLSFGMIWILVLILVLTGSALAGELPKELPQKAEPSLSPNVEFGAGASHVEIRTIQEKLIELGYYEGKITYEMDNDTLYALKLFCQANELEYVTEGITKQAYVALTTPGELIPRITPEPEKKKEEEEHYEPLFFGQVGDEVLNVQIRLKEMGYYEGEQLTPQHYDWGLQAAVTAFCTENGIAYDPEALQITESLQKLIFSDIASAKDEAGYAQSTPAPQTTKPAGMKYVLGDNGTDIRRLQERLAELGYYTQEISYDFDLDTLYALNQMCYENRLYFSEYGVSQEVWDVLFGDGAMVAVTVVPAEEEISKEAYGALAFGQTGEMVTALQIQLKTLGYFTGDVVLGHYEQETQRAIELFCGFHGIEYAGEGIDAQLHAAIFSNAAMPYSVEMPELDMFQRIRIFLMEKQMILGLALPGWGLMAFAVVLLAGFTLLIVWLFTGKPKETTPVSFSSVQGGSIGHMRTEPSVTGVEKMFMVDLSIRYRGKEHRERIQITDRCLIGRGEKYDLCLDSEDRNVSRPHCSLIVSGGGLVLKDDSVNGTFINDKHYHKTECVLHSGDRIQIGQHLLVIKF